MNPDFGCAVTRKPGIGKKCIAHRKFGRIALGAMAFTGLIAITAIPASATETAAPAAAPDSAQTETAKTSEIPLPSLGRHVRRAARLPFNVSLKFDDESAAANSAKRPSLARFVRTRGHGSEATTVDGYGPDRLVESLTFPADAPLPKPKATALADNAADKDAPGL